MIVNKQMAQSDDCLEKDKWETPQHIFTMLDREFFFTLDPCCEVKTAKAEIYYTPVEDGLAQDWSGHNVFVNPPYSRYNIDKWVKKCYEEGQKPNTTVVALLPVSASSAWWRDYVCEQMPGKLRCSELRFIKGRIRFVGAKSTAPFSSAVVIYRSINQTKGGEG